MKQIYDMLKLENIKILPGVKDWKEAIYTAVKPLVDGGYCEARYSDEIIKIQRNLDHIMCCVKMWHWFMEVQNKGLSNARLLLHY